MFTRSLAPRSGLILARLFSTASRVLAPGVSQKAKDKKEESRALARRLIKRRAEHRAPASKHPLYMDVPTAMRYLRAAEVGKAPNKTTVSAHVSLVPTKSSKPVQGKIFFPKPVKDTQALVFVNDHSKQEALRQISSGITVGGLSLISEIKGGNFDFSKFNQCYADPDVLSEIRQIAKILGPRGLMPLEKRGTVSSNIVSMVQDNFGAHYFKAAGEAIAIPVGRCDFSDEEIIKNIKAASEALHDSQEGLKDPVVIGRCHLSTTLGPAIVIDFQN